MAAEKFWLLNENFFWGLSLKQVRHQCTILKGQIIVFISLGKDFFVPHLFIWCKLLFEFPRGRILFYKKISVFPEIFSQHYELWCVKILGVCVKKQRPTSNLLYKLFIFQLFQLFFYSIPKLFGREQKVLESGPVQAAELFDPCCKFYTRWVSAGQFQHQYSSAFFNEKNSWKILQ